MDKKYYYLGRFDEEIFEFTAYDTIDVDNIRKLALLAITSQPIFEITLANGCISSLESYFICNPESDLKVIFEQVKSDKFAEEFLCLEVIICFLEDCFRKKAHDKESFDKVMELYVNYMLQYQNELQRNNKFYENSYLNNKNHK